MGLVFSRVWARFFGPLRCKICMVGLDNAGKTTILFQFHLGEVVETQPTIGSNVETVNHKNIELQVWDLGGQASIRQIWETYFVNSKAVILVIDSTDAARMNLVKAELHRILALESLAGAPILVLANKQDAPEALSADDIASMIDLTSIRNRTYHIQATSAKEGTGLTTALDWLATAVSDKG